LPYSTPAYLTAAPTVALDDRWVRFDVEVFLQQGARAKQHDARTISAIPAADEAAELEETESLFHFFI